jgi:NADH:ubiquinone oxidoreductase subunit 6 (subunit J)
MPLDIAMQNAQLKKPTNVDNTNYLFCVLGAVTIATAFLTIFRNPIHSALYLVICFTIANLLNSQFLAIVHIISL